MKKNKLFLLFSIAICSVMYVTFSSNSNGSGTSSSGCSCHGNNNTATLINITGIPTTGYTAGTAYTCTLSVTNTAMLSAGFNFSVNAGTISNAPTGTALVGTTGLRHTQPKGMTSGVADWVFTWTAPSTATGVLFTVAANAVNNNGQDSGDQPNQTVLSYNAASTVSAPAVTSNAASSITVSSAIIGGTVNANNGTTSSILVEYGTTMAYGQNTITSPTSATGNTPQAVAGSLTGLTSGTLYHYRITAVNSAGTASSADRTFTTLSGTSVNNIIENSIEIFPNPISVNADVKTPSSFTCLQASCINVLGETIRIPFVQKNKNTHTIDVSRLAAGNYILMLEGKDLKYASKITKL